MYDKRMKNVILGDLTDFTSAAK
jgi:hypothetical protein